MPPLLLKLVTSRIANARMPFFAKPIARKIAASLDAGFVDPQLSLHFGYIAEALERSGWFVGDAFSVADIQMSFPLEAGAQRGPAAAHPSIRAFLERIHARPAYRRALEKGGPYAFAE